MQINSIRNNHIQRANFKGFLNSRGLKKGLEFASNNGALFASATALTLSMFVRPIAILLTPKAEKENKQYAFAKSVASSLVGLGVMAGVSVPVVNAVKNITENPTKYLKPQTIKALKETSKPMAKSAPYRFASQLFKLSSAFVSTLPKAFLTCALIPPIMAFCFDKKEASRSNSNISFGSKYVPKTLLGMVSEKMSSVMGKILNKKPVQKFAQKYHNTNFAQHTFSANDVLATGLFVHYTSKNNEIKENRKKTLIYNASIMTAFTIAGGYIVNKLLDKPTQIFIEKFKNANKNSPKLEKYIDGIKIAKPALLLGALYYIAAPVVSTMLAEVVSKNNKSA